jgi:hypothetical protein
VVLFRKFYGNLLQILSYVLVFSISSIEFHLSNHLFQNVFHLLDIKHAVRLLSELN